MDPNMTQGSIAPVQAAAATCTVCHQPLLPTYYFCPNCGHEIRQAPLPTTSEAQLKIYAHSFLLPMILFFTITKWKGYTYFKSEDPQAKQIGTIAIAILVLTTVGTY